MTGPVSTQATAPLQILLQKCEQFWTKLAPRERLGVSLAATLLLVYGLWTVWVGPSWRLLVQAPAQHRALDESLARMLHMQAQAQAQSQRSTGRADSATPQTRLQQSLTPLGDAAQLDMKDRQASVTLKDISPTQLAAWLLDLQQLHLLPSGGQIQMNAGQLWQGRLSFDLGGTP